MQSSLLPLPHLPYHLFFGVSLRSSKEDIDLAICNAGLFRYSYEHLKDLYFEHYVLKPVLQEVDQINVFLNELDQDNFLLSGHNNVGCRKASVARVWINNHRSRFAIGELDWALKGLTKARRTGCSCHENHSFKNKHQ